MKHLIRLFHFTVPALVVFLCCANASAQQPPDFANMDPQQMQQMIQQRVMDNFREQLSITNQAEWNVVEPRLGKVVKLGMESMFSGGMGMMGGMRRGGTGGASGGFRGFPGMGQPNPDAENLQTTLDSNAPSPQIKAALAKLRDSRKQKQAELAKAREELRQVLTTKQEATLVLAGLLD